MDKWYKEMKTVVKSFEELKQFWDSNIEIQNDSSKLEKKKCENNKFIKHIDLRKNKEQTSIGSKQTMGTKKSISKKVQVGLTSKEKKGLKTVSTVSVYNPLKQLKYEERIEYLEKRGISFDIIDFVYNPYQNTLSSNMINPITEKEIVLHYTKDLGLEKKHQTLKGRLILKENVIDPDHIFSVKIFLNHRSDKEQQIEKQELNTPNEWGITERIIKEIGNLEPYEKIYFDDFVALHDTGYCTSKKHKVEKINALIFILRKDGTIHHRFVPAWYCHNCKRFFMSKWQYDDICDYGVPLCQTIKDGNVYHGDYCGDYYDDLPSESILYRSGYNVSVTEDLSAEQRRGILILLLESGIVSRQKIDKHLTWLISTKDGSVKMKNAVKKWTEDRKFISEYKYDKAKIVGVRLIRNLK